ncbi:hypothetical protein AM588_10007405 [Phytophthora nicotianae]|uniref:Cytochrome b5 heme-binding domain-containing protein n=1 Tax=Phytophthora nicotianae TaxID=4792 RepID=A0A0W8CM30_PHYNI|nr:hypothetical protein AM588_10007405 [Phytophthora nicotianae]
MSTHGIAHRSEMRPLRPPRVPVPPAPGYTELQRLGVGEPPQNADARRLRRAAGVLLLIFCLGTAIGLVHVIGLSQQVLARLEEQQMQRPTLMHQPHTQSRGVVGGGWQRSQGAANVLIAYSDGPHLSKLAAVVEAGARNVLGNGTKSLRVRTLDNASFADDVMWADAVILGTHVVNANVEPKLPVPFSILITGKGAEKEAAAEAEGLPKYTLDQLRMYDGSDEEKPILLAVGGKVLDVTSGAKFYAKGKSYNQFAGTACTRALALGSLKKEVRNISVWTRSGHDDVSDFNDKKKKELEETKEFYYEKYPIVRGKLMMTR